MLVGVLNRLQRISFFADKVADEIVYEETEILGKTIPRMFNVMQWVAKFLCDYVRCGRFGRHSTWSKFCSSDDRREGVGWTGPLGED